MIISAQILAAKISARTIIAIAKDPSLFTAIGYWGFTTSLGTEPLAGHVADCRKIGTMPALNKKLLLLVATYSTTLIHASSALDIYHYYLSTYSLDRQIKLLFELDYYDY